MGGRRWGGGGGEEGVRICIRGEHYFKSGVGELEGLSILTR